MQSLKELTTLIKTKLGEVFSEREFQQLKLQYMKI